MPGTRYRNALLALFVSGAIAVAAHSASAQTPDYAALIAATDRSDADREADKRRDPIPLLTFIAARSGMKVLDVGAGGGYSTELMARAVAPGTVYGQNPADIFPRAKTNFEARMKTPAMKNAVALERPFDDPVPPELAGFDVITFLFYYHDVTYMNVDRAQMNRKLFAALKPGGILVIADHSAKAGDGIAVGKTLHRIEEGTLRGEVEAAGFKLVGEGNFWRQPGDTRDFSTNRPPSPVDNFVLKFQKPAS